MPRGCRTNTTGMPLGCLPATSELHVSLGRELDRAGRDDVHLRGSISIRMLPAMHSGACCGSIPSHIVTWVQIMETLAAAASAPVFMRLPETQLQCQGRQVMAAMSVSPIVPEGWKYATSNLPATFLRVSTARFKACLPV